jgi:hypothetical protein
MQGKIILRDLETGKEKELGTMIEQPKYITDNLIAETLKNSEKLQKEIIEIFNKNKDKF